MRTAGAALPLAGLYALGLLAVAAPQSAAAQEVCGPDKLGVSRTITVNAATGPHFGSQFKSGDRKATLADGEIVLTFDDGPSRANTRQILDALAAQCTKATFFMVGQMAIADPAMVKEVAQRGHTVATHTWSHANLQSLTEDKAQHEIELGLSAVQLALGKPVSPFFRFPYLRDTPFALNHLNGRQIATFGIDIDSRDFELRDSKAVYERVIHDVTARRRGIILFHDIHVWTARAVPRILAELKARGFRIVHFAPKAGVETMAEYDALAHQESQRKRIAAARNPLSTRTIAWPSAAAAAPVGKAAPQVPPATVSAVPGPAIHPEEDWKAKIWHQ